MNACKTTHPCHTNTPSMAAAAAAALPSIFIILSAAFTAAAAHSSPPSNETRLVKACSEALGTGGASLVSFCAGDFLGHKADVLAGCGRRETLAVVLNEAHKKSQLVEDLEQKIVSEKSVCSKELQELKSCWASMYKVVSSVGNIYADVSVKKLSIGVVLEGTYEQAAVAKGRCKFSAAGRDGGLWLELQMKVKESLKAEIVALAFVNQLYSILD